MVTPAQKEEVILHLKDTQTLIKYLKEQSRTDRSVHFMGCGDTYDEAFEYIDAIINNLGENK